MAATDPLLQPFRLKHLALRNRFLSTAHEPAYTEDGMPKTRYRLYHAEKAKGGIALTMIGGSAVVAPDSPPAFGNILLYKDEVVRWLRELADRAFPKAVEDWDIARIIQSYADAAERCRDGGMDGIEIECYGHLADQFWSPATNRRDDEYGGALDNRMRFAQEVVRAIRARIGGDFILGLRMVCDEDWEKGLSREEGMTIAQRFAASGDIDFVNVIRGHIETDEALSHVVPGMGARSAPHLDFAGEVRAATRVPVFHAARIQDVATARHAVASGKLDMVGMTRAHIADPHIALKVAEGREADIRPCVGAAY